MKIVCDFCDKDEASVFCTADEAALCGGCDYRVHHANKLVSKHQRFSLLFPSSAEPSPVCDICQEQRAFLFCQQDRAILCKDCDGSIHSVNEHTKKHNRFLLTGVKLSLTSSLYTPPKNLSLANNNDFVPGIKTQELIKKSVSSVKPPSSFTATTVHNNNKKVGDDVLDTENVGAGGSSSSTSSISEYLIDVLPGWHVEDFLDSSSLSSGFFKGDAVTPQFWENNFNTNTNANANANANANTNMRCPSVSSDNHGIWVPQTTPLLYPTQYNNNDNSLHMEDLSGHHNNKRWADNNKRWAEDTFTVPQINPHSITSNKRNRSVW